MKGRVEVVVYIKSDYSENKSIFVDYNLSKDEVTKQVNSVFNEWYYYDIVSHDSK